MSSATVTPSLVTVGLPQPLSSTALRPRGPSVLRTARASLLTPDSSFFGPRPSRPAALLPWISSSSLGMVDCNEVSKLIASSVPPRRLHLKVSRSSSLRQLASGQADAARANVADAGGYERRFVRGLTTFAYRTMRKVTCTPIWIDP